MRCQLELLNWQIITRGKCFVDLVRNNIVSGYRNTCADPRNCYICNNS